MLTSLREAMPMSAANREEDKHSYSATVILEESSAALSPHAIVEISTAPEYAEKLRQGKSFLNLVLVNVATGINQHRLRQTRSKSKGTSDLINLYNETEKIGALQKPAIARLEKLFRAILKQEEFWSQRANWILTRLEQWKVDRRMPVDCSIPGMLSVEADPTLPEEEAWQESIVISACAFYTASEWLGNLDLSGFSVDEVEKLLGIRSTDEFVADPALFQGREIEQVATGYPILTGAQALINNQWEDGEYPYWKKLVGEGFIQHNIVRQSPSSRQIELVPGKAAWEIIQQFGPEAAYVLLIFSSYATDSEQPWEQQIRLRGTDLIKLFGWDKRTDITLGQKLKKISHLVELVCSLSVLISNINVGANRYNVARGPMWMLEELECVGQLALTVDTEQPGSLQYEAGEPDELYIKVRPGSWTEKFLNAKDFSGGKQALCQYGYLAKSTLQINPYRQRLASKLAIFLTIMSRIRCDGRYEVGTLLERLEPKELMMALQTNKQRRNALISQWNHALLTLHELGWQIEFDLETYPDCIRPEWGIDKNSKQAKVRPRNWLTIWLKAIVIIQPTILIQEKLGAVLGSDAASDSEPFTPIQRALERSKTLTSADLSIALDNLGWSKAQLAKKLGVDRSLITRWIKGERSIQPKHQNQIRTLLKL
ncbi:MULTISPECIES: helix-turn-helix transcriptional regulator [Trichocoleus]|uniref:Helix-turn-helix transcriptional regulator n=1 Tax=Trichocoleus desertorum GB2-A4 TaxID=2933944 RepID=A0ABV0JBT9_9CYAN|nr:helix-turn-helix transcriptional regulator [Trichocoleus sp. FACHB-46]MBD1865370.1 helix-turn-helix transcriptional regulator [Trichocoleus sp. FACHB-46]